MIRPVLVGGLLAMTVAPFAHAQQEPAPAAAAAPTAPAPVALEEVSKFPLGMSVSEFTSNHSGIEVSVPERGRRRFELNQSSLWDGVQSVTLDFIENKLAMVIVTSPADSWTAFITGPVAKRGAPSTWTRLTGTSLFERRIVEDSVAWEEPQSVRAYLREGSSSGNRHMAVLATPDRFATMKRDGLIEGSARQMLSANLFGLSSTRLDIQYARAFSPSVAGVVGLELGGGVIDLFIGESLAGSGGATPVLGGSLGAQWYPASGGAPKGFYLEGRGRLALTSAGYYTGVVGKLGYNFVFANSFAFGLGAGWSYMPDRTNAGLPVFTLDLGWAP